MKFSALLDVLFKYVFYDFEFVTSMGSEIEFSVC